MKHPFSSADINIFSPKIIDFSYIKKCRQKLHFETFILILLTFIEPLSVVKIKVIAILMMSAKLAIPCFLEIDVIKNKGNIIIYFYDVTNKAW